MEMPLAFHAALPAQRTDSNRGDELMVDGQTRPVDLRMTHENKT